MFQKLIDVCTSALTRTCSRLAARAHAACVRRSFSVVRKRTRTRARTCRAPTASPFCPPRLSLPPVFVVSCRRRLNLRRMGVWLPLRSTCAFAGRRCPRDVRTRNGPPQRLFYFTRSQIFGRNAAVVSRKAPKDNVKQIAVTDRSL